MTVKTNSYIENRKRAIWSSFQFYCKGLFLKSLGIRMFGLPPVNGEAIRPAQRGVNNWLGMRPIAPGTHNFCRTVPIGPENKAGKKSQTYTQ